MRIKVEPVHDEALRVDPVPLRDQDLYTDRRIRVVVGDSEVTVTLYRKGGHPAVVDVQGKARIYVEEERQPDAIDVREWRVVAGYQQGAE